MGIDYDCTMPEPFNGRSLICENSDGTIHCPSGLLIDIHQSNWGRLEGDPSCNAAPQSLVNTNCVGNVKQKMVSMCGGKQSCKVHPDRIWFEEPCQGTHKVLSTDYSCVRPVAIRKLRHVCEDTTESFTCEAGFSLVIFQSSWGRLPDWPTCNADPAWLRNTQCSVDRTEVIASKCNGRPSCSVRADIIWMGDPCPGTKKVMAVYYGCVPIACMS